MVLAGAVALIATTGAVGQETDVDVIRRTEEVAGKGSWGLAGSFSSAGESWSGIDLWGDPYTAVQTVDHRRLTLSGSMCLVDWIRLGAALTMDEVRTATLLESNALISDRLCSEEATSFSIHTEFIGDSGSRFDPRARLSLGSVRTEQEADRIGMWFGVAGSASYILDPVVLAATLDWSLASEEPHQWLSISISVGLVANSRITLSMETSTSHAVSAIAVPSSTVALRSSIALTADRSVRAELSFAVQPGSDTDAVSIGIGIRGTTP